MPQRNFSRSLNQNNMVVTKLESPEISNFNECYYGHVAVGSRHAT